MRLCTLYRIIENKNGNSCWLLTRKPSIIELIITLMYKVQLKLDLNVSIVVSAKLNSENLI